MGESAAVTAAGGVHGFPAALTSFIGRAGPVREVAGLLEQHRLVTVTGPGGVGKTRLAGEVARAVAGRFADGAWLAELAPGAGPGAGSGGGGGGAGGAGAAGCPGGRGAGRGCWPGSSCCWCWITASTSSARPRELCAGLLAACDDVRVLATSREPLARGRRGAVPAGTAGPAQRG